MNNSQNIENYIILKKNEISSSFLKSQKKWFSKPVLYDTKLFTIFILSYLILAGVEVIENIKCQGKTYASK